MDIEIRPVTDQDRAWVLEVFQGWGADFVISRGRKMYPANLEGFIARDESGFKVGLVTYEIDGEQCEIVTLDAYRKFQGIGTALIEAVKLAVREMVVNRLWLITTNDNVDAMRFYQKRGFTIAAVHSNTMDEWRKLKPSIPKIGAYGIPIRDEVEFEMLLGE